MNFPNMCFEFILTVFDFFSFHSVFNFCWCV